MSWLILGLMLGVVVGNWYAHQQIAAECERLGGFFVGKKTYLVDEIIDNRKGQNDN